MAKYLPALAAVLAAGLLVGCGSDGTTAGQAKADPTQTQRTSTPDPTDDFQPLAVTMVAPSGTYFPNGISGLTFGCSDTLVTVSTAPIQTESTEESVTAAIQFLLDDSQYYHGSPAVTNSLTLSETLELASVDISRNAAEIALTGDLVARGQCEAYRIQAQLYGTAAATGHLEDVSITVNDTELTEVLGLEPFDTTQVLDGEQ